MKQLGLLIVGAFLLVACDITPGGNKGILPITHDTDKEELVEATPVEETEEVVEEETVEADANEEATAEEAVSEEAEETEATEE